MIDRKGHNDAFYQWLGSKGVIDHRHSIVMVHAPSLPRMRVCVGGRASMQIPISPPLHPPTNTNTSLSTSSSCLVHVQCMAQKTEQMMPGFFFVMDDYAMGGKMV